MSQKLKILNNPIHKLIEQHSLLTSNFGFESNEHRKFGLELGVVLKLQNPVKKLENINLSDDLQNTLVRFENNAIIDRNEQGVFHFNLISYDLRRYTTGKCSFSLIPLKVQ